MPNVSGQGEPLGGPRAPLRLTVLQTDPRPASPSANARRIRRSSCDTDLVVTPELSLTGYDLRDEVHDLAMPAPPGGTVDLPIEDGPPLVAGLVERGDDGIPYNTAVVLDGARIRHRHRKVYLPTYGMFDEGRLYGRGDRVEVFDAGHGWRAAILICEDLWHPALAYLAALRGADLLIVPAAAPGRGVLEGGPDGRLFASATAWQELARVTARTHGIFLVLANRVGVEDGVTFAGGSLVVAPDGAILTEAGELDEARLDATLDPAALARARRPWAHWRDEDLAFLRSALGVGA